MKIPDILKICDLLFIFLKIIYFTMSLIYFISTKYYKNDLFIINTSLYWKEVTENIYKIGMALLIIFLFFPGLNNEKYLTKEIYLLLTIFGFILLFTSDWNFFTM
jgi:hypothetical protein